MLHRFGVELVEIVAQSALGIGSDNPFGGSIIQILENDVDADARPRPAEAMK
jgi:hypothetical protein